jgi:uncharacterized membrane protein
MTYEHIEQLLPPTPTETRAANELISLVRKLTRVTSSLVIGFGTKEKLGKERQLFHSSSDARGANMNAKPRVTRVHARLSGLGRTLSEYRWLMLILAAYVLTVSIAAVMRYYTFRTNAFDLGIFNQALSTTLKGKLFYETPDQFVIPSGSFLGTHFSLFMFLLMPLYFLLPYPQTLLVTQTVVIALGSIPIFLIARTALKGRLPLIMAGIYLVNPATLNMNLYDFHLEAFLPFFLGMFFYSYISRRWKTYFAFLALSLITIDFAAIMVCAICLAFLIEGLAFEFREGLSMRFRLGRRTTLLLSSTIVISLTVFYLTIFASALASGRSTGVEEILANFLGQPLAGSAAIQKGEFWFLALVSVEFLPALAPRKLVMVLPWLGVTFLGSVVTNYQFGFQYAGAFVAPYLVIGAIYGISKIHNKTVIRMLLAGAAVSCIILSPFNPLTTGHLSGIVYQQGLSLPNSHDSILNDVIGLIPANASVLTQNDLFPQVSSRSDAYLLLLGNQTLPKYVLADTTSTEYSQVIWANITMKYYLLTFLAEGGYGVLANDDGVLLLEQGYTGPVLLSGPTNYFYNYRTLSLYSGFLVNDPSSQSGTVLARTEMNKPGITFWFGPYATLPPGEYRVTFHVKDSVTSNGSLELQVSNFVNSTTETNLNQTTITQLDFPLPGNWTSFSLKFTYSPQAANEGKLEFRGVDAIGGPFYLDYIEVSYLGL